MLTTLFVVAFSYLSQKNYTFRPAAVTLAEPDKNL
jgi:hypothetical protein